MRCRRSTPDLCHGGYRLPSPITSPLHATHAELAPVDADLAWRLRFGIADAWRIGLRIRHDRSAQVVHPQCMGWVVPLRLKNVVRRIDLGGVVGVGVEEVRW